VNKTPSRVDNSPAQNFALAYAVGNILGGIWYVIYIWHKSLPDLSVYGSLFGIRIVFIKRQRNIGRFALFMTFTAFALEFLLLFILPYIAPERIKTFNRVALWSFAASVFCANILFTIVLIVLLRVYNSSLEALAQRRNTLSELNLAAIDEDDGKTRFRIDVSVARNEQSRTKELAQTEKDIQSARTLHHIQIASSWIAVLTATGVILGLLYVPQMNENFYISFSVLNMFSLLVSLSMELNLVFLY